MFQIVGNVRQIHTYQGHLEKQLKRNLSALGDFTFGFPGGNITCPVWANKYIWYTTFEITDEDESTPRFWNGFGLSKELRKNKSNSISVEINIPTEGIRKIVAGFFAVDTRTKNTFLFHRGRVGGGRKGIGKGAFLDWYPSKTVIVHDKNGSQDQALLIGALESKTFIGDLTKFVKKVAAFRQIVTSDEVDKTTFLSNADLAKKAKETSTKSKPKKQITKAETFERNPYIVELVKRMAKGRCQLCNKLAPFKNRIGKPFLEAHHITWLSNGGLDSIENTVALCPNCHRKMHIWNRKTDQLRLIKVSKYHNKSFK